MEKRTHDYKDTIAEAAELDNSKSGKFAAERVKRAEAEAAYEALAVTSSMGMLGMEQTTANLLQLELAQEWRLNTMKYTTPQTTTENITSAISR